MKEGFATPGKGYTYPWRMLVALLKGVIIVGRVTIPEAAEHVLWRQTGRTTLH